MSILLMVYKLVRTYLFPMWQYIVYLLNTNSVEYFMITRRNDSCVMLPIFDEFEEEVSEDSFILIRYNVYTSKSSNVYHKVIRDAKTPFYNLVCIHRLDSLNLSNYSFIDCQSKNEDDSKMIPMSEFSLVSNELFFELFNEWLWMYYLNDDYLSETVTTLIDKDINIITLKNQYIKLEKNNYVIMDDNTNEDNNYVIMNETQDKKND